MIFLGIKLKHDGWDGYTLICIHNLPECSFAADIVAVIDSSKSVGEANFRKQLRFLADLTKAFTIGPNATMVGVITFSTAPHLEFNLHDHMDAAGLEQAILAIRYIEGRTHTDQALQYVRVNSFMPNAGHRPDVPKIVLVLTDGRSNEAENTKAQAQLLRDLGVIIYTIGIGSGIDLTELGDVASGPEKVINVAGFDALGTVQRQMETSLCQQCSFVADIVAVIDSSTSVGVDNFSKQLRFLVDLTKAFTIGPNATRVGVITFATLIHLEFNLSQHMDATGLEQAILGITYMQGGTYTDQALQYVRVNSFMPNAGHRPGVPKIVLVITDGRSNVPNNTKDQAQQLRESGVIVYTIGIGSRNDPTELENIASGPEYVVRVDGFDALSTIQPQMVTSLCQQRSACQSDPCKNGATCTDVGADFTCTCTSSFYGTLCETERSACQSDPCKNGATCTDVGAGFTCTCTSSFYGTLCETDLCADVAADCRSMFGVCRDPVKRVTLCRKTCGVCGHNEIMFLNATGTPPPTLHQTTPCTDALPNCRQLFGVCRNVTMASTSCRHSCGICSGQQIILG